ncbi:hypothetical protein JTB14_006966 [Gonioctena quinquepunctata]|nr:hypothetical protein JTB14_006966 [Gonioctena quinquepunctata]
MYVYENASERLVELILAHCREDEVAEEIMYDDLCIKFGNKLCKKYRGQQHSNMIRTRLRELGKFIMEVKKMDGGIKNLSDILVPVGSILEYREQYGVSSNNPVFGTVGKQCFLRACNLLKYYSMRCGAPNPNRLRGIELGKQIATACKMYNLPDLLIEDVANHLGHDISIHESIYRQSLGTEVPVIANILLKAMGSNIGESDDDECPNDGYVSGDTNRQEKSIITPDCSFATRKTPTNKVIRDT